MDKEGKGKCRPFYAWALLCESLILQLLYSAIHVIFSFSVSFSLLCFFLSIYWHSQSRMGCQEIGGKIRDKQTRLWCVRAASQHFPILLYLSTTYRAKVIIKKHFPTFLDYLHIGQGQGSLLRIMFLLHIYSIYYLNYLADLSVTDRIEQNVNKQYYSK